MEVISAKVDKRTKDRMKRFSNINWSKVIREAIARKIREEELRKTHPIDRDELLKAAEATDALRARQAALSKSESWNSIEEIRKWRERR